MLHRLSPAAPRSVLEQLPSVVRDFIQSSPAGGEGVNLWCIRAARRLHRCGAGLSEGMMEEILETHAGRPLKGGEALRAIRASDPRNPQSHCARTTPRWPQRNLAAIEEVALAFPGTPGLRAASPVPPGEFDAESAVDLLFPGHPLLCVGSRLDHCATRPREEWRWMLAEHQFIVPSPMSARQGRTREGRWGARTLDNTGPRRFLVIEFDFREKDAHGLDTPTGPMLRRLAEQGRSIADLCCSLHLHLRQYWPLAMAVHSGGKSLHGWYPCTGRSEEELGEFMRYAVSLGADPATWTRCQFVRLPGGLRAPTGVRQSLQFVDPTRT